MFNIESLNFSLFQSINNFVGANKVLDFLGIFFAEYLIFIFLFWLLYLWLKKREYKVFLILAGFAGTLGVAINSVIHSLYFHPRPFSIPIGTTLISHSPNASFPSGHATLMFSIAILFLFFKKTQNIGYWSFLIAVVIGVSRVFCGIHFPLDILGSLGVSLISSLLVYLFYKKTILFKSLLSSRIR